MLTSFFAGAVRCFERGGSRGSTDWVGRVRWTMLIKERLLLAA